MTVDDALDFLRSNRRAVLATRRRDGGVQMSPVVCAVAGDGSVVVSTQEPSQKVRNLRREPHASLCVMNDGFFGAWVQVEGPVAIEELPAAMDALVDYYRRVAGEHPDWDDYRAAMTRERRVLLRMRVERAGGVLPG